MRASSTLLLISSPLTLCLSMTVSNCGCGSANQKQIVCRSDGGILRARQGADCAALIQSQKPCVLRPLSSRGSNSRRSGSWLPCRTCQCVKNSTSRRARFMPRRSGVSRAASLPCARTLAVITLDKLSGALARASVVASEGIILLTSRVSVEMVQKSAAIGAPVMVSVSAPTALAVRMADAADITLAAIARADGFEVFTHPPHFIWSRCQCRLSVKAPLTVHHSNKWAFDHEDWNRWCGKGWLCMCARGCGSRQRPKRRHRGSNTLKRAKAVATDLRYGTPL